MVCFDLLQHIAVAPKHQLTNNHRTMHANSSDGLNVLVAHQSCAMRTKSAYVQSYDTNTLKQPRNRTLPMTSQMQTPNPLNIRKHLKHVTCHWKDPQCNKCSQSNNPRNENKVPKWLLVKHTNPSLTQRKKHTLRMRMTSNNSTS